MRFVTIFTIRIVYKSGYTHDFEVTSFSIKGNSYEWTHVDDNNKPIQLGPDEIAAVYQIGTRKKMLWK